MDKKALIESFKAIVRTAIFGFVSWLLTQGVIDGLLKLVLGSKLDPSLIAQLTVFLTVMLTTIDKSIHDSSSKTNGLLPKTLVT